MPRPKPKVKMYIEVKPGQDEKLKKPSYPRKAAEISTGKITFKLRDLPGKDFDSIINFFKIHGIIPKITTLANRAAYINVHGHKIVKIGKNELAIPVRGATLDEVLMEVQNVEKELKDNNIKYERKCTWVCGM